MSDRLVNWFQFMVANPWMDGDEFTKNIATIRELVIIEWLDGQGVLCDCDNGVRYLDDGNPGLVEPCGRCTLVEFKGGIRVRADKDALTDGTGPHYEPELLLPVVEVTDEAP